MVAALSPGVAPAGDRPAARRDPGAPFATLDGTPLWADPAAAGAAGDLDPAPRPPLEGDTEVDVAIVGAGLTGIWTAWELLERDPGLRVLLIEREHAGFGASGRNGGWCSALFPASAAALEARHGREAAVAMRRAMVATVDEVGRASAAAGVDAHFAKGGTVVVARSAPQLAAARAEVAEAERFGVDALELRGPAAVHARGALGAVFDPSCARVHPGRLSRGMARALEARGARIAEGTTAIDVGPHRVTTDRGVVRARWVVLATEGYGAALRAVGRRILPLYSLMIATEPLPGELLDAIGLPHGRTFSDGRHLLIYGQRTADDRIAFGGRGARYHLGSAIRPEYDRVPRVFAHLRAALLDLFPTLYEAGSAADGGPVVTHGWGGPLGVPRDWHASVHLNRRTGVGFAGGYVGDGLSTTNLAGRTLADLITGADTELTRLPWVGHVSPRWEPEPLRFLGANVGLVAMRAADAEEAATGRPSLVARAMAPLLGH